MREKRVVLEDDGDVPLVRRHPGDEPAADRDVAGVGDDEAGDHPKQRGLAAAGRPQQRDELALGDAEVHAVDHRDAAKRLRGADDLEIARIPGRSRGCGFGGRHYAAISLSKRSIHSRRLALTKAQSGEKIGTPGGVAAPALTVVFAGSEDAKSAISACMVGPSISLT